MNHPFYAAVALVSTVLLAIGRPTQVSAAAIDGWTDLTELLAAEEPTSVTPDGQPQPDSAVLRQIPRNLIPVTIEERLHTLRTRSDDELILTETASDVAAKRVVEAVDDAFQDQYRIPESAEFLDDTAVHPESYPIARAIMKRYDITSKESDRSVLSKLTEKEIEALAKDLSVGKETLKDILSEIVKPSRDPRKEFKTAKLREDIKDIKDLKPGLILEGTIRNVTGFGFFVDLGIEINGLVHVTEIREGHVEDPHRYGKPGDIVKVKVKDVDLTRKRISLTMKGIKQE